MIAVDERKPAPVRVNPPDRAARIADLVSGVRQGSDDALGHLLNEFSPLLWHVTRAAGLSPSEAEDVLQTVWMRLLEHLDDIRTPTALAGWLVVTARREAWRVREAERKQIPTDHESFAELPDQGPGLEEQVMLDDQRRSLWTAIRQLSPRCQELLRIVAFVPRPDYPSVAAELGMRLGSVGPTRGRCLAKLRALLASGLEENSR